MARAEQPTAGAPPPAITLRVVASRDEARSMRETLADLLSRVGIQIAAEPTAGRPALVDVAVDLSSGSGAPFVELTAEHPPDQTVTICQRQLDANVSRDVLIETAAQVVYTAVETRARTQGLIAAGADPLAVAGTPPGAPHEIAPIQSETSRELRAQASTPALAASYGIDLAAIAETRVPGLDPSRPSAGGGLSLTWALRRRALGPALTAAVEVQRPIADGDPQAAAHLSTISVRLIPTVNAVARRWMTLQIGPSLAFDLSRGDVPASVTGQGSAPPIMGGPTAGPAGGPGPTVGPPPGPMTGANGPLSGPAAAAPTGSTATSFSAVALSAGAFARLSIRITRHAQLFSAAGIEDRFSNTQTPRPNSGQAVNGGPTVASPPASNSTWRSSLLAGVAFTVAGASTCACFADTTAPPRE